MAAKYRQHGYQDRDRESRKGSGEKSGAAPPKRDEMMHAPVNVVTRAVSRCTQCGTVLQGMPPTGQCPKCGFELHSCKQCTYFDPGSRVRGMQPVAVRIPKKDERNECPLFEIRVTRGRRLQGTPQLRGRMMRGLSALRICSRSRCKGDNHRGAVRFTGDLLDLLVVLEPKPGGAWLRRQPSAAVPTSSHQNSDSRSGCPYVSSYGFCVGLSRISLTKDCGACVTSMATAWATSSG